MRKIRYKWLSEESYVIVIAVIGQYPELKKNYKAYSGAMKKAAERKVKAVDSALALFGYVEKEVIKKHFFEGIDFHLIYTEGISGRTMRRACERFVKEVAKMLGEI